MAILCALLVFFVANLVITITSLYDLTIRLFIRTTFLPWLDDEIRENIRMKHYFMTKAHTKDLEIFWQMFKYFRNIVADSLKIKKGNYYTNLILENEHKPKLMWKCLRERMPSKNQSNTKGIINQWPNCYSQKKYCKSLQPICHLYWSRVSRQVTPSNSLHSYQPPRYPNV